MDSYHRIGSMRSTLIASPQSSVVRDWLRNSRLIRNEGMHTRSLLLVLGLVLAAGPAPAASVTSSANEAALAVNQLGLDLYRQQIQSSRGSVLLSPYSVSTALAMTYLGADGKTAEEMQRVLHFPGDAGHTALAFQELSAQLAGLVADSKKLAERMQKDGGKVTPIQLDMANRLFAQQGYPIRPTFLQAVQERFASTLAQLDFKQNPAAARLAINDWVSTQTHGRISNLLPENIPDRMTRLVLVNALYLKAAWADEFMEAATMPEPFHLADRTKVDVPIMHTRQHLSYAKRDGYSVVALPYLGNDLQLLLFVPDAIDGLATIEAKLKAEDLVGLRELPRTEVDLALPKFKLEPDTLSLGTTLKSLGLRTAFDDPRGSANFDRMAPRTPEGYLKIDQVVHKTWLALDEHGTEAAAATAVIMTELASAAPRREQPIEVRADRPFLFAIQHVESGACLFLGRVTDPRSE